MLHMPQDALLLQTQSGSVEYLPTVLWQLGALLMHQQAFCLHGTCTMQAAAAALVLSKAWLAFLHHERHPPACTSAESFCALSALTSLAK
jgi:hypothetical protein